MLQWAVGSTRPFTIKQYLIEIDLGASHRRLSTSLLVESSFYDVLRWTKTDVKDDNCGCGESSASKTAADSNYDHDSSLDLALMEQIDINFVLSWSTINLNSKTQDGDGSRPRVEWGFNKENSS